ncbi:uncharacterized protein LOC117812951 isoform X1 [Xyrichtys novacula]|uniref:Uncharacterized protein LOC117812951 isoform X1 n=1 Tax=Xyrichtys novacula TaxID=13765 RepID=A0AAV1G1M7_XYRNO|nr:uncharacterized protein LOC117812951 isoform X1 [Xyrichtys novacula]
MQKKGLGPGVKPVTSKGSEHHHAAPAARQKRKRAPAARPSAENHPAELTQNPAPQHSTSDAVAPPLVQRPQSMIPPTELPSAVPGRQPSTAPVQNNGPLMIHHYSVQEYQQLFHSVVDDMLGYKTGRPHLGRVLKQKLWERSDRPSFSETADENGLVHVGVSYGVGVFPPLFYVDTSLEPKPKAPP